MDKTNFTYFQYHSVYKLPVYLRVDLGLFEASFPAILENMKFTELSTADSSHVMDKVKGEPNGRILTLRPAGIKSSRQISSAAHSDRYGVESVISKSGYKVYRYRGTALLVYSLAAKEWECGVTTGFGTAAKSSETKTVLGRYLSWALAPHGLVGFWGVPVDEGVVVLRQNEANGEIVFFDIKEEKLISMDGVRSFHSGVTILRLDSTIKGRNIRMGKEELFSFLSMSTSFMDPEGLSIIVRQLIHSLSLDSEGLIHPQESFRPRSETSL